MRSILSIAFLSLVLVSCGPELPEHPPTPAISFVRFAQPGDSLQVSVHFVDGDGDLGVPAEHPSPNMYFYFYHRNPAGDWVPTEGPNPMTLDTLIYPYRVPELPTSQKKVQEGEITVTMEKAFLPHDTLRMEIRLFDRAGHASNWVTTPELILH